MIDLICHLIDYQLNSAFFERMFLSLALVGATLVFVGWMIGKKAHEGLPKETRIRVRLRVVALLEEPAGSEGPSTSLRPRFEIQSSPYKGVTGTTGAASNPAMHAIGDVEGGWYSPQTGIMESDSVLRSVNKLRAWTIAIGTGAIIAGLLRWNSM